MRVHFTSNHYRHAISIVKPVVIATSCVVFLACNKKVGLGKQVPFQPDKYCALDYKLNELQMGYGSRNNHKTSALQGVATRNAPQSGRPKRLKEEAKYHTPTKKVQPDLWPSIFDDLNFSGMITALDKQIARFEKKQFWDSVQLGEDRYNLAWIKKSTKYFRQMVMRYEECLASKRFNCEEGFEFELKEKFHLYEPNLTPEDPRWDEENNALFTAYYTPQIRASNIQTPEYPYPVYQMPGQEVLRRKTRDEIDFEGALKNKNLELFYTDNLFDLYLMQIEGGGLLMFKDEQKFQYVSYAGTNNQTWRFISQYMLEKKYISDGRVETQRKFLQENPDKNREIYASCPSYVYFKKTNHEPLGSDMVTLTPNRSVATDDELYKFKGLLVYVMTQRPVENQKVEKDCRNILYRPYSRFYLDQDTGGAIVGKSRADLFFGEGEYAELAAHNLVQKGKIYFLMMKKE